MTVEILPHGDAARARVVGTATIANVSGDGPMADYQATLECEGGKVARCAVIGFERLRYSAWELLRRALNEIRAEQIARGS